MSLVDPKKTIEVIQSRGVSIRKRFGQNFLIDARVLERIVNAADIGPDDCVIEIGPGLGTMTEALAARAGQVIAIEIDGDLIPVLRENLGACQNVMIVHGDVLRTDIRALIEEYNGGRPVKVVANLPYYITTPILMKLLEERIPMISATVMVQKEVADRMSAGPGTKDYGALSLAVQYYSQPHAVATVPPNCFIPRPGVDSAVVRLDVHPAPPVSVRDEELMFGLIRAAFEQRRKTLVNAISGGRLGLSKEEAAEAVTACGLDPMIRGEALGLAQFAALADELSEVRG